MKYKKQNLFYQNIGLSIKRIRKFWDIKAQTLAQDLNMSVSNFTSIERGETKISLDTLVLLAEKLNVSLTYFFESEDRQTLYFNLNRNELPVRQQEKDEFIAELRQQIKLKDTQIEFLMKQQIKNG
jgi:transcriptional regulator with XRE-family HTH domain